MEYEESKPGKVTLVSLLIVGLLVPLLVAAFLLGLQPPLPPQGEGASGAHANVVVKIPAGVGSDQSLNYEPSTIRVVVGINNTIQWNQDDTIPHTVTSSSVPQGANPFDSKNLVKGDFYSMTLTAPGTYQYYCVYHPGWMKGTVIVLPSGGGPGVHPPATQVVKVFLPNGVGSNPTLNFRPAQLVVVLGVNNTVQWVDQDPTPHTVTSVSVPVGAKGFDSGIINMGGAFTVTFVVPGTYKYHCTLHPGWMIGTVVVKPSS